ncbi:hypothetical protein K505DRAFT_158580 [Melanomma pulvis-pyrius CBS 109.77]|uniref:Uncharacterized protein n=1 Tax=Melanomma pulvis-pyrius CBS 109.77 TaxID=1314802 RepID=A0A6A6XJB2_9PLEO|nr:hypothetical protein K505DRAFT_158580 [Melanomma pulvis-pyrius CBS 109.77]
MGICSSLSHGWVISALFLRFGSAIMFLHSLSSLHCPLFCLCIFCSACSGLWSPLADWAGPSRVSQWALSTTLYFVVLQSTHPPQLSTSLSCAVLQRSISGCAVRLFVRNGLARSFACVRMLSLFSDAEPEFAEPQVSFNLPNL